MLSGGHITHREPLRDGHEVHRQLPDNVSPKHLGVYEENLRLHVPDVSLCVLRNITVTPRNILLSGSVPIPLSFRNNEAYAPSITEKAKFFSRYLSSKLPTCRIKDTYFVGTDKLSCEYFHWLMDALPRIYLVNRKYPALPLAISESCASNRYALASLAPLNIKEILIVKRSLQFDTLFVPTHAAPRGNYHELVMREIRDLYQAYFCSDLQQEPRRRLYISRRRADSRRVINEDEVMETLAKYGFEHVCFEDYSFAEQVRLAFTAKCMVSSHGAGLSNMLFMPSNGSIIEFKCQKTNGQQQYWKLASALRHHYFYQFCQTNNSHQLERQSDMWVDTVELETTLRKALSVGQNEPMSS